MKYKETQVAIKEIKDFFETKLGKVLNLTRVSAPLFVRPETGLNDNLTGNEKPVSFKMGKYNQELEIVQSLAKWKREALKVYGFEEYEGLYTDMDAIRPHEILDATHSLYVDQWDWEKIIKKEDRNFSYLKKTVEDIYQVFLETEELMQKLYPGKLIKKLPDKILFISTQELEDLYPNNTSEEREYLITKKYKAVFIHQIGKILKSGKVHDLRAPDYDDWDLNGDILLWNPVLGSALELSSMGIRVDERSLLKQLKLTDSEDKLKMNYHDNLVKGRLPYTIGGGIGQSRICMYFLDKKHIGEVQASIWTEDIINESRQNNIFLL